MMSEIKLAIVTVCERCHHSEGDHDEDGCRGGEDVICKCTDYWPEDEVWSIGEEKND